MKAIFFLLIFSSLSAFAQPFDIPIPNNSIGYVEIVDGKTTIPFGTTFLLADKSYFLTCNHVVSGKRELTIRLLNGTKIATTVTKRDVASDQAILTPRYPLKVRGLSMGDFERIQPGALVYYVGWDTRQRKFVQSKAQVQAKGTVLHEGKKVAFIEFEGNAIPGYSGGPVLNSGGQVIGILRESWLKQGKKGSESRRMNRAFALFDF